MVQTVLIVVFAVAVIHCYGAEQVQMPEHAEIQQPADDDLQDQVRELQRNMTDIWTYIQELRTAVSHHLKHLRLHQEALETSVHKLEHAHEAMSGSHSHDNVHGDSHHHSGEHHSHGGDDSHRDDHGSDHHSHTGEHHSHSGDQHSHSGEHHSHSGDQHSHSGEHHSHSDDKHSHSGEHHSHSGDQHSHSGENHSHSDDKHSHSGEHHSHSGDQHSHSGEHHSHSDDKHSHSGEYHSHSGDQHSHSGEHGHHTHSESHSHSSLDHSKDDNSHSHHSHGSDHPPEPDHKDSHETEDLQQTIQQVAVDPVVEPVVVATTRQEHYHHHHREQKPTIRPSNAGNMDLMNENSFHHHHHHHHHDHHGSASKRNRTVELPKYSDYDVYNFAVCNVQPNRAIPEEQQQNVGGQVTLWQKKTGGPLNIHVRLQGFQMGDHHAHHGAHQAIQQEENNETPQEVVIHKHGFHIHASGDLSNGCQSTGPHYNPKGVNHGGPTALVRHVGDLGNIQCDDNGFANLLFSDDVASLQGPYSIVGKAMVIHSKQDDLGLGGDDESLRTGNAGTRIACCVIQGAEKLPIRHYRAMKSATQYQNY